LQGLAQHVGQESKMFIRTALTFILFVSATAFAAGASIDVLSSDNDVVVVKVTGAPTGSIVEAVVIKGENEAVVGACSIDPGTGMAGVNLPTTGYAYKLVVRCPAGSVLCSTYNDEKLWD
jgi:hypothetical protein